MNVWLVSKIKKIRKLLTRKKKFKKKEEVQMELQLQHKYVYEKNIFKKEKKICKALDHFECTFEMSPNFS